MTTNIDLLEKRVADLEEEVVRLSRENDELYRCIEGDANLREMVMNLKAECEMMGAKLAQIHGTAQADFFFMPRFGQATTR